MAYFEPAFDYLMQHEDPGKTGRVTSDSGGLTRWGISQKAYPELDIRNLTLEQAAAIYRRDYFQPVHGYQLGNQRIASKLLDMAVNMGVKAAVMILQVAINIHCAPRGALLVEDGMMGSRTIIAVNNADTSLLLTGMQEVSAQHYQEIARKNPSEEQYLQGWLRRASELPRESDAVTA